MVKFNYSAAHLRLGCLSMSVPRERDRLACGRCQSRADGQVGSHPSFYIHQRALSKREASGGRTATHLVNSVPVHVEFNSMPASFATDKRALIQLPPLHANYFSLCLVPHRSIEHWLGATHLCIEKRAAAMLQVETKSANIFGDLPVLAQHMRY